MCGVCFINCLVCCQPRWLIIGFFFLRVSLISCWPHKWLTLPPPPWICYLFLLHAGIDPHTFSDGMFSWFPIYFPIIVGGGATWVIMQGLLSLFMNLILGEAHRKLCAQSCKANDWVNFYTIIQYLLYSWFWTASARYNLIFYLSLL